MDISRSTIAALALSLAGPATLPDVASAQDAGAVARAYLDRIAALDDAGPQINAVITTNPDAPEQAAKAQAAGLPLNGRTVLVKDNIETKEWPTTAGSLALADNATGRDAPLIVRLRAAGGVVLGKTNLSEWANFRDDNSTSGWSGVGGLTRNPHATDRTACGSSSGSGAAVAAGFAWAAIGTETDGSIVCPASINGIVGFKPTVGMVSRTLVVPISVSQDTAGPMATSVYDAALLLTAISGSDPDDPATAEADAHKVDFTAGLAGASLKGVRIGVLRKRTGPRADVAALFDHALGDLRAAGAVLVDVDWEPNPDMNRDEFTVLLFEFREGVDAYLAGLPEQEEPRTLADLVMFNTDHADGELRWFGQALFELAQKATDREAYLAARANSQRLARAEGIDKLLADNDVAVLIAPTNNPAWTIDLVNGDHFTGGVGATGLAAVAGYPHLTVPMGAVEGLPIGLSIVGAKWHDAQVLQLGAAYERARTADLHTPEFKRWGE
ncbi:MAG: amidase [Sphingomonadales bacterium]|nr:amidase [Sphingomonadales bacterium]MBD3773934.1 amidase [Paracoccaceae bacterium]